MIYDFQLHTGINTAPDNKKVNVKAIKIAPYFILESSLITGNNVTRLSANGQTLYETTAQLNTDLGYDIFYGSGDYFTNTGSSSSKPIRVSVETGIFNAADSLLYDVRSGIPIAFSIGNSGAIQSGITGAIASVMPEFSNNLGGLDFFLNGQKLYSGVSYTTLNTSFVYLESITGILFSIPKASDVVENAGGSAFVYGSEFVEDRNGLYINGMEQDRKSWLECSTGVTTIDSSVRGVILNTPSSGTLFAL